MKVTVTLPTNLRDAATFAVDELDAASTIADLLVNALREYLESVMIPTPQFERKDKNVKPNLSLTVHYNVRRRGSITVCV